MAHEHSHGEGGGTYFLDQLFTILSVASFGVMGILLYQIRDRVYSVVVEGARIRIMLSQDLLSPEFWPWVYWACIAVVILAVIRAVDVWRVAGQVARKNAAAIEAGAATSLPLQQHEHTEDCGHDHSHSHGHDHAHGHAHSHSHGHDHAHGEDCGHDHAHSHSHDTEHSHSHADADADHHDHGWSPWKYLILCAPILLSLFLCYGGIINLLAQFKYDKMRREGIALERELGGGLNNPKRDALSMLAGGVVKSNVLKRQFPTEMNLRFKELSDVAAIPMRHEAFEGEIGIIRGQYWPLSSGTGNEFQLFRMNITCCAPDAVMLQIRIVAPAPVQGITRGQWVQVRGVISFERGASGWVAVLTLDSLDDIRTDVEPTNDTEGT